MIPIQQPNPDLMEPKVSEYQHLIASLLLNSHFISISAILATIQGSIRTAVVLHLETAGTGPRQRG